MTLHPRLTRATVALVKRFETFQPTAERTPEGGWSIGYGHTRSAREGARVTPADAEALLIFDLDVAARAVERALFAPVTQGQFEALTALCFNLGEAAFLRCSALARVNAGAELDAADEIERWRRAELGAGAQVVDALVRRRAAEKAHFLGLPEGASTWPSAQRRPLPTPGGETVEAAELEAPASASIIAANGVQARLRRLIPDHEPQRDAPATPLDSEEPELERGLEPVEFESEPAELERVEPPASTAVAWEPTPPPFDPPTEPAEAKPTAAQASAELTPPPSPPPVTSEQTEAPAVEAAGTVAPARPPGRRGAYALLGLLGAALFLAGAAMILTGRPNLLDLGLGVAGVLLAAPGLYGLLGDSGASDAEPRDGGSDTPRAQP